MDADEYIIDQVGRVGRLLPRARKIPGARQACEYAYGIGQAPRAKSIIRKFQDPAAGHAALLVQRHEMWDDATKLMPLAQRTAKRFARPGTQAYDELISAAGVHSLCYAVVTHNPRRGSLRAYARLVLICAYAQYVEDMSEHRRTHLSLDPRREFSDKSDDIAGLLDRDELYMLGLSGDDISLLLARFDSEDTLEQIAYDIGAKSRSTPLNRIQQIIDRCREGRNKPESSSS